MRKSLALSERCRLVVNLVNPDTRSYLERCFWTHYNAHIPLIQREVVLDDNDDHTDNLSSQLLQLAILATGLRYADSTQQDVRDLRLPNRESTLHWELKALVEMLQPTIRRVTYVQVLMLLSDLEYGRGHEYGAHLYLGWLCLIYSP